MPLAPQTSRPDARILASTRSRSGGSRVVREHERGHDGRRARAVRDDFVERGLDARVADGEDHVLDRLRQRRERRDSRARRSTDVAARD